ncbi:MAG: biotin--[acetyl-CoA-carboxylase] ligase [Sedimentitalea sp.]
MKSAWPEGYGRRILDSVDSTLTEARRLASDLTGPEWILAHEQTDGRGRRGRGWVAPAGNFSATLVTFPREEPGQAVLRSFVAALALCDACRVVSQVPEAFTLKWPNDVLCYGGKLAGILLESVSDSGGIGHLAIGIGVNLAHAPPLDAVEKGAVRPVSLYRETGVLVAPELFLDALATAYAHREHQFTTLGFEPIRAAWLTQAARLGEVIRARTQRDDVTGVFETVDETGHLVLKTAGGRVHLPAADIYF